MLACADGSIPNDLDLFLLPRWRFPLRLERGSSQCSDAETRSGSRPGRVRSPGLSSSRKRGCVSPELREVPRLAGEGIFANSSSASFHPSDLTILTTVSFRVVCFAWPSSSSSNARRPLSEHPQTMIPDFFFATWLPLLCVSRVPQIAKKHQVCQRQASAIR
jgi:hypothetical protein